MNERSPCERILETMSYCIPGGVFFVTLRSACGFVFVCRGSAICFWVTTVVDGLGEIFVRFFQYTVDRWRHQQ